jgi:hypothetical protein
MTGGIGSINFVFLRVSRMECVVCLNSSPAPVALGCSCRATAGFAHVECMALFARASGAWRECRTCKRAFTGRMLVGLGDARWNIARKLRAIDDERTSALRHLAASHSERGRYTDAARFAREARDAVVDAHGEDHPASLRAATELANVIHMGGCIDEAIDIHNFVVAARAAALGEEHVDTLSARANLASCISDRGRAADLRSAERIQRRMLDVEALALGERHVSTLTTHCDLAVTLSLRRKYDEARGVYDRLVPVLATELGPEHPMTVVTMGNMANCLSASGDDESAERLLVRVVEIARRVFGPVHPDTRVARRNLARTRSAIRRRAGPG